MNHVASGLLLVAAAAAGSSLAQTAPTDPGGCAPVVIPGHYGPYDYVTQRGKLNIVEQYHFTPNVEQLRSGTSGYLGGDLSYTLNAGPNHHRALHAAMRFAIAQKTDKPPHLQYAVSCYFDRATRFRPKDTVVRGLYAKYLFEFMQQKDEALRQVEFAALNASDNPLTHFNIGTLFFEMGAHDKAAQHAARAQELGFPRDTLINKLKGVNKWPTEATTATSTPASQPPQNSAGAASIPTR